MNVALKMALHSFHSQNTVEKVSQDIFSNMVVVFMSLFMVLYFFFILGAIFSLYVIKNNQFEYSLRNKWVRRISGNSFIK